MNELLWLFAGLLTAALMGSFFRLWRKNQERQKRHEARQVLMRYGLTPQLYLATIGESDPKLRAALDEFSFTGHIITNGKGEVVGKLCPRVSKRPHLRLVVSNDEPSSAI